MAAPAPTRRDNGHKVVASDEGGEISEAGTPAPKAKPAEARRRRHRRRRDAVVRRVRSEQAVAVGGVKAMPAVRALANKLGVDLARVRRAAPMAWSR